MRTSRYTNPIIIDNGTNNDAVKQVSAFIESRFSWPCSVVVCDENTNRYAMDAFPLARRVILAGNGEATLEAAAMVTQSAAGCSCLIACGAGTVHDVTRFAAHDIGIPFISYPTAPSMDGFISGVAAMTVRGLKVTYPSTPPIALFSNAEIIESAPRRLMLSGIGDIIGKYISLLDWRVDNILTGTPLDSEIEKLVQDSIDKLISLEIESANLAQTVMEGLVASGMAIQLYGSSRPASGAEHHLSHLWEMSVVNEPTGALHGEQVGFATLLLLDKYKSVRHITLRPKSLDAEYLQPVFAGLTEQIIAENTPSPLDGLSQRLIDEKSAQIHKLISALPDSSIIRNYYKKMGMKSTADEIGLPNDSEFLLKSLEFAPYVRNRLTLLKII